MAGKAQPPRAWQRMLSGRRLNLTEPSPLDIEIEDIAHGLARVARWNGQTHGAHAFSVAQHCWLVERLAVAIKPDLEPHWRLAALLHDAPEYVIGDMISPFKAALGLDYKAFEHRLMEAIHIRFSLPATVPMPIARLIKKADKASAYLEAVQLAGFSKTEAKKFFTPPAIVYDTSSAHTLTLEPWPPEQAAAAFLKTFNLLGAAMPPIPRNNQC